MSFDGGVSLSLGSCDAAVRVTEQAYQNQIRTSASPSDSSASSARVQLLSPSSSSQGRLQEQALQVRSSVTLASSPSAKALTSWTKDFARLKQALQDDKASEIYHTALGQRFASGEVDADDMYKESYDLAWRNMQAVVQDVVRTREGLSVFGGVPDAEIESYLFKALSYHETLYPQLKDFYAEVEKDASLLEEYRSVMEEMHFHCVYFRPILLDDSSWKQAIVCETSTSSSKSLLDSSLLKVSVLQAMAEVRQWERKK